jgi:hypothetical protein
MTLKAEIDTARAFCDLNARSADKQSGGSALADPTARELLRRLGQAASLPAGNFSSRLTTGERARSAAKRTHPKGDPPS